MVQWENELGGRLMLEGRRPLQSVAYFGHHQGQVVKLGHALGEIFHCINDGVADGFGVLISIFPDYLLQTLAAE